jgi:hypothetical protein
MIIDLDPNNKLSVVPEKNPGSIAETLIYNQFQRYVRIEDPSPWAPPPTKPIEKVKGVYTDVINPVQGLLSIYGRSYSRHLNIVVSPLDLWFIVLNELAEVVKANTEEYRNFFTTSSEKVDIAVLSNSAIHLPIDSIIAHLRKKVPIDLESFVPKFSTHDNVSTYGTKLLKKIKVTGTVEDWKLFTHILIQYQISFLNILNISKELNLIYNLLLVN